MTDGAERSGGMGRAVPVDVAAFAAALRSVDELFDVFCDYAGEAAGLEQAPRFAGYLPLSGAGPRTRCEVWRRYLARMARDRGDVKGAAAIERCSDAEIIEVAAEAGYAL